MGWRMMINWIGGDKDAETEGQSSTERENSIFFPAAPETRHFMYPPPLPQLFMDYHKISLNSLKAKPYIKAKINIRLSVLK